MTFLKGLESVILPPDVMTKVLRFIRRQDEPERNRRVSDYAQGQIIKGMNHK